MAEVPPAASLPCFPGAYYRKAVSSLDVWTGIEGAVTLPTPRFDEGRRREKNPEQFLDNPSVYVGGRGEGTEIDAGVTWEVVRLPDGTTSADRRAFRPFWRNKGWHAAEARPEWYFYPGDTIRMRIETGAAGKLTLRVELVSRGEAGEKATAAYGAATRPAGPLVQEFDASGFTPGRPQQFKRVNAIDQVGREGKEVEATRAAATGAVWKEVTLLRGAERVPMEPKRFTDMRCPGEKYFTVRSGESGGERVDIVGTP